MNSVKDYVRATEKKQELDSLSDLLGFKYDTFTTSNKAQMINLNQ